MYYVANSHEAIISEEVFNQVKCRLEKNSKTPEKRRVHNIFTGIIRCGLCGTSYIRKRSNTGKYKFYVWTCRRLNELGKDICPSKPIREDILVQVMKDELGLEEITNEVLLRQCRVI